MANSQRRMVYVKIWTSEQFGKLPDKAKLLFVGMITLGDDDGRLRANPAYLRGQIFPYDETVSVSDVLRVRNEIEKNGLITLYSVDGFDYIEIPKWPEYQKIRKDLYKPSTLPSRNETVTKPLRNRTLSQVKLSKDNTIVVAGKRQKSMKEYSEKNFSDSEEDIIDEETGEKVQSIKPPQWSGGSGAVSLLDWAIKRRERGFNSRVVQFRAMKAMKANGYTPQQIKDRWIELENDKFWQDKLDFSTVAKSFDKKPL